MRSRKIEGAAKAGPIIDELTNWLMTGKRRTAAGAVRAIAKRRGVKLGDFVLDACAEIGTDGRGWMLRRVAAAIEAEAATREAVHVVEEPHGLDACAVFPFVLPLGERARVALGVLSRFDPGFFTGGGFAREVSLLLVKIAANNSHCAATFARAAGCLDFERDEKSNRVPDARLLSVPDLLAMPDESAPLGFVTLADLRARRAAADKADDAATGRGGVK